MILFVAFVHEKYCVMSLYSTERTVYTRKFTANVAERVPLFKCDAKSFVKCLSNGVIISQCCSGHLVKH